MSDYEDNQRQQRRRDLERAEVEGRFGADRVRNSMFSGCLEGCGRLAAGCLALAALIAVAVGTMVG
jgi:hypothetical protein